MNRAFDLIGKTLLFGLGCAFGVTAGFIAGGVFAVRAIGGLEIHHF